MQKPYISVIIPLYNKELIVERSIKSVLNQSFKDFELIIVDDGSTDGSVSIVESIHDDRIRLFKQENGGPSKARNTGVKMAKGDWVLFLDADDELLLDALETFLTLINKFPNFDIYNCGRYVQKGREKHYLHLWKDECVTNNFKAWYFNRISPGTGATLFRKAFILSYPYDESLRRYEDGELLFRILKKAKIYTSSKITEIHNVDFSEASHARRNICDDFIGHLYFHGLSFWGRMCMYKLYLENRDLYPEQMRRLYPLWRFRYDLLLINKLANALLR